MYRSNFLKIIQCIKDCLLKEIEIKDEKYSWRFIQLFRLERRSLLVGKIKWNQNILYWPHCVAAKSVSASTIFWQKEKKKTKGETIANRSSCSRNAPCLVKEEPPNLAWCLFCVVRAKKFKWSSCWATSNCFVIHSSESICSFAHSILLQKNSLDRIVFKLLRMINIQMPEVKRWIE